MSLDDLRIERTPGHEPPAPESPPEAPSLWRWVAVALSGIAAGGLLMFWWLSRAQPTPAPPPAPTVLEDVSASSRPIRQPLDLPSLGQSDTFLTGLVAALSDHPWLARFLATRDLMRASVLAVVQIGDGRTPIEPLKTLRPLTRVQMAGSATGRIEPASYKRWDVVIGALVSIAPKDAAQLYVNVKPLVDEAYIDLGQAGDFDQAIVRAIQLLADTPEPVSDPVIGRRPGYLEHEDVALRALKPVQKQLLLMGPENRSRLMGWLRQFASALDLKL